MKKRILFLILAIALLLTACGTPSGQDNTSQPTGTAAAPTGGATDPTQPQETDGIVPFELEGNMIRIELIDDTTASFASSQRMELPEDTEFLVGTDIKNACMTFVTRYTGTYTLDGDTYTVNMDKVYMGLELEANDVDALRTAFLEYVEQYAPESQVERYTKMVNGEYVDVTEDEGPGDAKIAFRLNGNKMAYLELYEDGELDQSIEYADNGSVMLVIAYYEGGSIRSKTEYNDHGHVVLRTYYTEDGAVAQTERAEYEYSDNGEIKTYKYYENDILTTDGEHYANGEIKRKTSYYSNGQIANNWEYTEYGDEELYAYYSEDGILQHRARWEWVYTENGTRVSCKTYNTNDVLTEESAYHDNGVRKLWLTYDESGNLQGRHEYDEKGNEVYAAWYDAANGTEPYSYTVSEYAQDGSRTSKYYEHGKLREETEYFKSGNRKAHKRYYDNGQVECYREFADFEWFTKEVLRIDYDMDGNITYYDRLEEEYHENGVLKSEKHYDQHDRVSSESNYDEEGHQLSWILYDENGTAYFVSRWEREVNAEGMTIWEREYRNDVLAQEDLYYDNGMMKCRSRYREDTGVIYYYAEWNENGEQILEVEYDEEGNEIWRYEYN